MKKPERIVIPPMPKPIARQVRLKRLAQQAKKYSLRDRRTAYHEAGHATVAWSLHVRLHSVTMKPGQDYLGRGTLGSVAHASTMNATQWELYDERDYLRLAREIKIAYAGMRATKFAFPNSRWREGAGSDLAIIADYVLHAYMDQRMQRLWSELLMLETDQILRQRWYAVEALAQALLERKTLNGHEAHDVLLNAPEVMPA